MRSYKELERPEFTPELITELKAEEVFVFGSNLAGFRDIEIAPLFTEALRLENVCLPETFVTVLK